MDEPCEYDQSNGNPCSLNLIYYNSVVNRNKRGSAIVLKFLEKETRRLRPRRGGRYPLRHRKEVLRRLRRLPLRERCDFE